MKIETNGSLGELFGWNALLFRKKWTLDDYLDENHRKPREKHEKKSTENESLVGTTRAMCNADPKAMKKLIHHLALITEIEKQD